MAKIKKRKLVWKPSNSAQVIGYKIYWSEGGKVDYHCASAKLGNVNEVVLPDDVDGFDKVKGPVELGITAVDELGNESDLVVLKTPYQFNVPQAPSDVWIETLQQYHHTTPKAADPQNESEAPIRLVENKSPQSPADGNPAVQNAATTTPSSGGVSGGSSQS